MKLEVPVHAAAASWRCAVCDICLVVTGQQSNFIGLNYATGYSVPIVAYAVPRGVGPQQMPGLSWNSATALVSGKAACMNAAYVFVQSHE